MNFEILKSILIKSNNKQLFISIILLFIGFVMAVGSYSNGNNKTGWIISILFILFGLLVFIKSLSNHKKIKNNTLPLLQAIKNQQTDDVVWIYQKDIISKVEGVKVGKSSNLCICFRNDKYFEIVLGKKTNPEEVITYLSNAFPRALIGFSEENKKEIALLFKNNKNSLSNKTTQNAKHQL